MKKFFFLAAAVAGLLSIESCKKCGTCTVYTGTATGVTGAELCGDDYTKLKDAAVYSDSTKIGTKCTDK